MLLMKKKLAASGETAASDGAAGGAAADGSLAGGTFLVLLLLLVWLLLLPLLLGNSTYVVCQSLLNHQNGGEFTHSCISIAALGLISAAFPARLTPHPTTVDLSENYFIWPGHTGDAG
jgi:hypothetical protein